jgi:hypothetical protein
LITDNKNTDELTNRSVHLSSDSRDTDELTNKLVHLSSDSRDTYELTNRSIHLIQSSESRLVGNELTNRSVHFRVEKDELTNISVQSWQLRETILQTDQINLYGEIEDESTNRSTQS